MEGFVNLAQHLIESSTKQTVSNQNKNMDEVNFDADSLNHLQNVGTAKVRTVSSTTSNSKKQMNFRKSNRPNDSKNKRLNGGQSFRTKRSDKSLKKSTNLTDTSYVPIDLSNYSKPSKLDIVLPEYIVDYVESLSPQQNPNSSDVINEAVQNEKDRAAEHKKIEEDVKKAIEAMKDLEKSYELLSEQIETAKQLFPENDATRKALDDIITNAPTPSSILKETHQLPKSSSSKTNEN